MASTSLKRKLSASSLNTEDASQDLYREVQLPPDTTKIRILELLPSNSLSSPVEAKLHVERLSVASRSGYEALSYAWGVAIESRQLTVNGEKLDIRTNLNEALLQLRQKYVSRRL